MVFVYESANLISLEGQDIIGIPDQEFTMDQEFPLPDLPVGTSGLIPITLYQEFNTDTIGQRIDSAYLKGGSYKFIFKTDLNRNQAYAKIKVPSLLHSETRDTLQFNFNLDYNPGTPTTTRDTTFSLENHVIIFSKDVFNNNRIKLEVNIFYTEDGNPNNSPYFVELDNAFDDLQYSFLFGYLGSYDYTVEDTLVIEALKLNEEGQFNFGPQSVVLNIEVDNSIGLPVQLTITDFEAYHDYTGDGIDITINPSQFEVDYPDYSELGQVVETNFENIQSDVENALNNSYSKFFIATRGTMNYENDSTKLNFIADTSQVRIDLGVELKLFGSLNKFLITDTVGFDFEIFEELSSLMFRVIAENSFPLSAYIQLNMIDSLGNVIHGLIPENETLVTAAPVSDPPDYRVVSPSRKETDIVLTNEELELVSQARKIIITAELSTYNGQLVKIYSDYNIRLRMGVLAGYEY
ncbi:MAG: hypothetical protein K8R53_08945 [Bacteroidales bacterium]|nr:hypothetical protein [Bacteroidales bacterium]